MGGRHQRAWRAAVSNGDHLETIGAQWREQVLIRYSAARMHDRGDITELADPVVIDIFH